MRIKHAIIAAGTAGCLVACGSPSGSDDKDRTTPASTSTASPSTVVPTGIAAAGAELKLGQQAVVPWQDGYIGITVTAVEPGDVASFRQKFGSNADGMTPYYIRLTLENLGGTDLSTKNPPLVRAVLADGSGTGTFITGSVDACSSKLTPKTFTTVGAKFDTCRLDAAAADDKVTGAKYAEGRDYQDKPVLWTR
ncbi:hypothetical protein [Amycolatopsis plumensis]|uniref:Lipoprotein n=1 Tax=Amycolatopsis plumensis TaxID=236508 RepID=A0ABV5UB10_9PSEU